jgi:hypothetical protein
MLPATRELAGCRPNDREFRGSGKLLNMSYDDEVQSGSRDLPDQKTIPLDPPKQAFLCLGRYLVYRMIWNSRLQACSMLSEGEKQARGLRAQGS